MVCFPKTSPMYNDYSTKIASGHGIFEKRRACSARFSGTIVKSARKDGIPVAYWNFPILQDVGVQALIMHEPRKCNADTACLSEITISDAGHAKIKVLVEETCYHPCHSLVVDSI